MLKLDHVTKMFGARRAVDDLSLEVAPGEVLGLLGPNGAGKSTTVSLAVGVLVPDTGRVSINGGGNPRLPATRRGLGVATQSLALYDMLSGAENLAFFGAAYGLAGARLRQRVQSSLAFVGLSDRAGDRVQTYSGGMMRRLNLAAAIVHEPTLILLDEPTVGVDPQSRNQIFENILALKRLGCTIVYTTHYMEEAARLCDRIAIIDHGKLLAVGTVPELLRQYGAQPTLVAQTTSGECRIPAADPLATLNQLATTHTITSFQLEQATLEQVFLHLTGRSLRD
jgi:ABC-2 type transport system ATP-binding protein